MQDLRKIVDIRLGLTQTPFGKKADVSDSASETVNNQNRKRYMSLGIFFSQPEISEKTPLNPHSDWVYNLNIKNTKKLKKIPYGIFSVRLVSFLTQNHIRIFQQNTSRVIPKISASDNGKKPNTSRDTLLILYLKYVMFFNKLPKFSQPVAAFR